MKIRAIGVLLITCLTLGSAVVTAAEVSTVLEGLNNPCGIAVQPGTKHVFVSDSAAGRVVRVVDGKAQDVIVGFPQDIYGKGPMYNIGPLGLVFLDKNTLVVGGGGRPDGEEKIRVYKVPAAGQDAIKADNMEAGFELPPTDETKGEGNFYALAATSNAVYATCNGDDTKGWVAKLTITSDGSYGSYERFIATKEATEVDAPVGITMNPQGQIAVGQMGEITIPHDSLLTFYDTNGKMLLNLETELFDITALAYSPANGQLYATDYAWMDTGEGGLFQLIADGEQGLSVKKVESLDKPTAMAFGEDGVLYVTVFGSGDGNSGKLLKVSGL